MAIFCRLDLLTTIVTGVKELVSDEQNSLEIGHNVSGRHPPRHALRLRSMDALLPGTQQ